MCAHKQQGKSTTKKTTTTVVYNIKHANKILYATIFAKNFIHERITTKLMSVVPTARVEGKMSGWV